MPSPATNSTSTSFELDIEEIRPVPTYPYFGSIPKTLKKHLEWRRLVTEQAEGNEKFQRELMDMCRRDSLFWACGFCWLFEPRPSEAGLSAGKVIPFIPWVHQVPAWTELERWMGFKDVGMLKSRAEGASWMICLLLLHKWLYVDMFAAGLVSKDEDAVDNPINPDSLMWKMDWQLEQLPRWMMPKPKDHDVVRDKWGIRRTTNTHTLMNLVNKSTIVGFAASPNVGSGGRKTVFVMDEFAKFPRSGRPPADQACVDSVQHVTNSRIMISTPFGPDGAYYRIMNHNSDVVKIELHWSQNPTRVIGAYRVSIDKFSKRHVELEDKQYWLERAQKYGHEDATLASLSKLQKLIVDETATNPFRYRFMLNSDYVKHGQLRSVWYDNECRRPGATPRSIAQELDLDFGGSSSRFFDVSMVDLLLRNVARKPVCSGELTYETMAETHHQLAKTRFRESGHGRLLLWFDPHDKDGILPPHAPRREYIIGCDISSGIGGVMTSNSALVALERHTGKQVLEFATPNMLPDQFADFAVALCYWLHGPHTPAFLVWEANGPNGGQFSRRIITLGYNHVYFRKNEESILEKVTPNLIGYFTTPRSKPMLLGEFSRALKAGEIQIQSELTLNEAKSYMNLPNNRIEHIASINEEDPSGAGERHGDRVIAAAVAWWVTKDYVNRDVKVVTQAPPNSFAGRRLHHEMRAQHDQQTIWTPKSGRRKKRLGRSPNNLRRFRNG